MLSSLNTLYDALDDSRLNTLKVLLPYYSSWRDQSTALNLAVSRGMVGAVRLLVPYSDVLQNDGQILKTAVFMGNAEMVGVLLPSFKEHPRVVNAVLEKAVRERNLPVLMTIWDHQTDRLTEVQAESLKLAVDTLHDKDDIPFCQDVACRVQPEVVATYFEQVLQELSSQVPSSLVGNMLAPLTPWVPVALADAALDRLGRDAMPEWFRHWESRQLRAVDTPDNGPMEPRRRL